MVREIYLRVARTDERLAVVDCNDNNASMLPPEKIFTLITNLIIKKELLP
jgi:hypothetical protein